MSLPTEDAQCNSGFNALVEWQQLTTSTSQTGGAALKTSTNPPNVETETSFPAVYWCYRMILSISTRVLKALSVR
jgi:hypothetical protein